MAATSQRSESALPAQPPSGAGGAPAEPGLERAIAEAGDSGRIGRRVFRNLRRIELWSVFKVSLVFYACMYGVALVVIALAWAAASENGLISDIEGFVNDVGWDDWSFQGDQMFRDVAFIGGVLVGVGAVLTTLAAALFNLVSEALGGFRIIVIEEESVPSAPRARRRLRHAAAARVRSGRPSRDGEAHTRPPPGPGSAGAEAPPDRPPPAWAPSGSPPRSEGPGDGGPHPTQRERGRGSPGRASVAGSGGRGGASGNGSPGSPHGSSEPEPSGGSAEPEPRTQRSGGARPPQGGPKGGQSDQRERRSAHPGEGRGTGPA